MELEKFVDCGELLNPQEAVDTAQTIEALHNQETYEEEYVYSKTL